MVKNDCLNIYVESSILRTRTFSLHHTRRLKKKLNPKIFMHLVSWGSGLTLYLLSKWLRVQISTRVNGENFLTNL